ncbi:hypothetical protein HMPREF9440_00952 [Sutterella parvirubra YIT 11816]|uniref:Uncharacterized protein n=1 Tax=Sutterella parvirubra YIT 11816 TaxID=762967 RepID=H3KDZ1_9BURK|nr:hypothetical protein HMPREF9440_00952 [Sutterella parvirubra YIT 11816]
MNNIFRKVFNARRGRIVEVDETKTSASQRSAAGEGFCFSGARKHATFWASLDIRCGNRRTDPGRPERYPQ